MLLLTRGRWIHTVKRTFDIFNEHSERRTVQLNALGARACVTLYSLRPFPVFASLWNPLRRGSLHKRLT